MTDTDFADLGVRLRELAPPMAPPPDLMSALRPRVRKQRLGRLGSLATTAAVVTAAAVMVPSWLAGPARLPAATVRQYLAVGDAAPVRYTGPAIPDQLKRKSVWLVEQRVTNQSRLAIVSYARDGHPCLGSINVNPPLIDAPDVHGFGFQGDCSFGDQVSMSSYQAFGSKGEWGPDALLFGTAPAAARIVVASVIHGQLLQRYAATIATPADQAERFYVFDSPAGAANGLDVRLTFYDAHGTQLEARHLKFDPQIGHSPGFTCTPGSTSAGHGSGSACATLRPR